MMHFSCHPEICIAALASKLCPVPDVDNCPAKLPGYLTYSNFCKLQLQSPCLLQVSGQLWAAALQQAICSMYLQQNVLKQGFMFLTISLVSSWHHKLLSES